MEQLVAELRRTNSILLLAFGPQIEENIERITTSASHKAVLAVLSADEREDVATASVITVAKSMGIGRTQAFQALAALERAGAVERRRRGFVAIAEVARAFVAVPAKRGEAESAAVSDEQN